MKRISLEKLISSRQAVSYRQQYDYVLKLLENGKIKPVKASGLNGKSPALYQEYWICEEKKDFSSLEEELKYQMTPLISVDYYLGHVENYEKDRKWVLLLNEYLKNEKEKLNYPESVNERSFEIWSREKFLTKEQGLRILKRCGLSPEFFYMYETTEPLAYYSNTRKTPQNLLILENKDPFYSMRRHLMEGETRVFGVEIGTLIYGAGKGIIRSFRDFEFSVEPYMKEKGNKIYYFGDMDYEGIGMYEGLAEAFGERWEIIPFIPAYEAMLLKAESVKELSETKEKQNRNIKDRFFSYFSEEQQEKMKEILGKGRYIPQEILNIMDF